MSDPNAIATNIEATESTRLLKALGASKGPDALHELVDGWHDRIDQFMASSIAEHRIALACHAGCAWCCQSLRVDVTAPEAFRIKAWLAQNRTADEHAALTNAARAQAAKAGALTPVQYSQARITCLFLADGRCSIYAVRPATCRTYHSLDVDACERKYVMPALREGAIAVRGLLLGTQGFLNALRAALRKQRLDANTYELSRAMVTTLTVDNAFALWRQGKKPFGEPPPADPPVTPSG